ncbi:MAG: SPOR domain-containing protein [Gemmatimonadales bacterium]
MTDPARAPGGSYQGAGRQAAVALRGYSSVVVTSDDIVAAAHAAIGIALAESAHRLVMVADLGGETAPLQTLVREDDSHGIYDSFEFGTSFVRVAREVEGTRNFFVMPSGTESAATETIIGSPRWQTFASEFASADELLLIVVKSDAPGLDRLVSYVDGVVLVGVQRLESAPTAHILTKIPHPTLVAPPRIDITRRPDAWSKEKMGLAAAGLLALGIVGGAMAGRRGESEDAAGVPAAALSDSAAIDSANARRNAILPSNPQDSSTAAAFSVEILASNTAEGANFEIQRHGSSMPAATVSLVPIGDTEATWYKVHAGAYADSAQADRLLATLRRRRLVPDSAGTVVRAPLALLVDSVPAQAGMSTRVREKLRELESKGVHAYALMQRDGSARVYAGAFERAQQSSLAATALRVAGLSPVLAYRTGRLP